MAAQFWPAAVAALVLGLAGGGIAGWPRNRAARSGAVALGVLAVVLVAVAILRIVPGRGGLFVETAAACLCAYLIGCVAAASIRRRPSPRGELSPTPSTTL